VQASSLGRVGGGGQGFETWCCASVCGEAADGGQPVRLVGVGAARRLTCTENLFNALVPVPVVLVVERGAVDVHLGAHAI
jgi:hypothetical protein